MATESFKQKVWARYQSYAQPARCLKILAHAMGISHAETKRIVSEMRQRKALEREQFDYRIMRRKRQGLRLVRVKTPAGPMDWYTDKSEAEIKREIEAMRERRKEAA